MRADRLAVSTNSSKVEVWHSVSWLKAVKVPSLLAPAFTLCLVSERNPSMPNICGRETASLTGRLTCLAAIAERITCDQTGPLLPKPPPRYGEITRTLPG